MNPSESVALQLRLDAGDPYHSHKMEALKAAGMGSTASFPLRLNAFPAGLLEVLVHSLASAFAHIADFCWRRHRQRIMPGAPETQVRVPALLGHCWLAVARHPHRWPCWRGLHNHNSPVPCLAVPCLAILISVLIVQC